MNNYKPRYWLINGRGFPDSIADNGASLAAQPALRVAGDGQAVRRHDPPAARRWRATSTSAREDFPFHPHGNNGLVIGRDGTPLDGAGGDDLSFEKFAINIGPGQTWDVLFNWYDAEDYCPANPVPVDGARPGRTR